MSAIILYGTVWPFQTYFQGNFTTFTCTVSSYLSHCKLCNCFFQSRLSKSGSIWCDSTYVPYISLRIKKNIFSLFFFLQIQYLTIGSMPVQSFYIWSLSGVVYIYIYIYSNIRIMTHCRILQFTRIYVLTSISVDF